MKELFSLGHAPSQLHKKTFKLCAVAIAVAAFLPAHSQAQSSTETELEEVVVTGTYLSRLRQSDVPSPTTVLGADFISDIGAGNIGDIVQNLTINAGSQNNPDAFTQNGTVGTSNFNLRGLGVASTLVLLNGRRQVNTAALTNDGVNFVDTNALIPQIAIKRVEIVKDGAAAIYGTDAVAGVVNFITDNDFRGSAVNVRYAQVTEDGDQEDVTLEAKFGWGTDKTDYVVAASYYDRSELTTKERRLSRARDDTSSLGNPGAFFLLGALPVIDPTGCASEGGQPLPRADLQPIINGIGLPFQAGFCGFDFGDFFTLVPEEERINLFGSMTHDFDNGDVLRVEATYAKNEALRGNSPTFPFLQLGNAVVPVDNPGNVFPASLGPILFFGRVSGNGGTVSPSTTESDTFRLSAELSGAFRGSNNWQYDAGLSYSKNEHITSTEDTVTERFSNALNGFGGAGCDPATGTRGQGPCQFFNPFSTSFNVLPNDPALLDFVIDTQTIDSGSELIVLDAVLSGAIGSTAAGPIGLAVGAQYRKEDFSRNFDDISNNDGFAFIIGSADFEADRDIVAVFAETSIPLTPQLDLGAAIRYEDYGGNIGDTIDPKVSLLYRPNDSISVRTSLSSSFRAPSQFQTNGQGTSLNQVSDPLGGTAFAAVRNLAPGAGGRDIQPEQSDAFNFGVSFNPGNFSLDVDYWSFDFTDAIIQENFQAIVNADPNGPRVVRSPAGTILFVFTDYVNASSIETDGLDIAAKYDIETDAGIFTPFLDYTQVFNYDIDDPQAGQVEGAGNRNFTNFGSPSPETRYTSGVKYAGTRFTGRIAYRYIDSYTDDQNDVEVDSFSSIDAQVNFNLADNYSATIGVTNLSDEQPPQVFTNGGFDSRTHDPRGRLLYVQLSAEW
ncbi:MAG: iron complex outermembrane receptor protein [Arenicella sp.]|jgi:iron complex outermembrane receptor protein